MRTLSLIILILAVHFSLFSQNTTATDTLVKKNVSIQSDTTLQVSPAPVVQQQPTKEQTAAKPVRKDNRPLKDRLDFDFNTSFWANTKQVFGEINVLVWYKFPKILRIGTGPTYIFNYQRQYDKNLNGFGGKVIVRADLLNFIYASTEYQGIDNQYLVIDPQDSKKYTTHYNYVDSWFVTAGVNIRLGRRNAINMSVNYDLLYDSKTSPYYNALIYRVGYSF
jgi:hypothetical protein